LVGVIEILVNFGPILLLGAFLLWMMRVAIRREGVNWRSAPIPERVLGGIAVLSFLAGYFAGAPWLFAVTAVAALSRWTLVVRRRNKQGRVAAPAPGEPGRV
jgi:hypothetical protein